MAAKIKGGKGRKRSAAPAEPVSAHDKIARLLGVLATKDLQQVPERVVLLRAVGFEVSEVASILGMTENHVRVAAHQGRKKQKRNRPLPEGTTQELSYAQDQSAITGQAENEIRCRYSKDLRYHRRQGIADSP